MSSDLVSRTQAEILAIASGSFGSIAWNSTSSRSCASYTIAAGLTRHIYIFGTAG